MFLPNEFWKQLKAISKNFSEIRTFQLYFMQGEEAVSIMIIAITCYKN